MQLSTYVAWSLLLPLSVTADNVPNLEQQPIQLPHEDDPFDHNFDTFVEDTLRELHIPGLSIAVVNNGKISSKGYGFAILPDQKATADTKYFTASTTKAFTAAAAALLVHDNDNYPSLKWTSPINQFLRADFVLEDEYATSHTTIEDALSHRTGLPGHDLTLGQANGTPSKVVQRMRYLPMTAQPRTQWQYCNMMYAVITDLIQTITGTDLETLLREKFWEPLGMRSTTFKIPSDERERSRLARGYYWSPQTDEYVPDVYLDLLDTAGDGAIISTVNDYALWMKALLNAAGDKEAWNSSSPITRSIYHDLVTPRTIIPDADWQESSTTRVAPLYALGWVTAQVASAQLVTHGGGITGFGTQVFMLPGQNYGVVTMGNTLGTSNEAGGIIASKLLVEKLNLTAESVVSASTVHQSLLKVQRAGQYAPTSRHRRRNSYPILKRPSSPTKHLPLPLPLPHFAGLYSHPAYGTINITLPTTQKTPNVPSPFNPVLETLFNRTSVEKYFFMHTSGTVFQVQSFEPHGLGDIVTGEGIVWEEIWEAKAIFEFGIDGGKIERVGIELEPDMVSVARQKGNSCWREGMIWFGRD